MRKIIVTRHLFIYKYKKKNIFISFFFSPA